MNLTNIKFIGEEYKTEIEKEEKFQQLDKLKQDKLIFLNSFYNKEDTIKNM